MFTPGVVMAGGGFDATSYTGTAGPNPIGPLTANTDDTDTHIADDFIIQGDVDIVHNIHIVDENTGDLDAFGHQAFDSTTPFVPMSIRIDHNSPTGFWFSIWADKGMSIDQTQGLIKGQFGNYATLHPLTKFPYSTDANSTGTVSNPGDVEFGALIKESEYDQWDATTMTHQVGDYVFYRLFFEEFPDGYSSHADAAVAGVHSMMRLLVNANDSNDHMSHFIYENEHDYDTYNLVAGNHSQYDVQDTLLKAYNNARMITVRDTMPVDDVSAHQYDFYYSFTPSVHGDETTTEILSAISNYGWKMYMYIPESQALHQGGFKTVLNVGIIDKGS